MSSSSSKSSSHDAPSSSPFARNNNENNTTTFNRRRNSKSSSNTTRKNRFVFAYKRAALRAKRDVERKSTNARNSLLETKVNFENAVIKPLFFFGRKSEEKEKTFVSKRSSKEEANWAQKDRWNALRERAIDPIKRAVSSASGGVSKGGQFFTKNAEEKEGKMKSGSYVSSPAKEEVPKKNKKDEDSAKRFNGFVFPLEKERKRVEERWKEVVEKMKKERMATFTSSSSSSSSDARKHEEQQKNKNKNADNGKEGRNNSSLMIKAKAEKMTKEVSLKLNENVSKVNAAIEARKKETEEAFTSAKRRVMAMTVKKDAERDDGKHKNKRRENNKSSTSTNSSSSNNNNNNNRDSENKKNKKKTATGEEPPPTNIFERSKSAASDFFGTATASMEDVKGNIESVQKSVAKKLSDMQLRENFEGTTQNIARESKKLVTEDLPSTIKTLSKESANLTGSALKEFNENIDVDVIAQNAKKSFEGTSKTVETLIRDVHSTASLAAVSGKALVTDLIDPPEKMHRVRQGESLLKIARKYDVSVVDVCRVNNLAPTDENPHFVAIKIGQVLNIPNPERMAEQPAYESSKFDEKYESTVNAYYEQRLNASSSSSSTKSKVAVATSEVGGLGGGGGAANIRIAESSSSSSSSGNAKLAGSFALLATAAAISYLRAGLDDDSDDDNNDSNTNNNTTIGGERREHE